MAICEFCDREFVPKDDEVICDDCSEFGEDDEDSEEEIDGY